MLSRCSYDEHGGFYDHVSPPTQHVPNPDGIACKDCKIPFNFDRLGVRIPMILISPWIAKGTLIHDPPASVKPTPYSQMELSSLSATLHHVFNTSAFLTRRDAWAVPLNWVWETTNLTAPRTDCPTTLPVVPEQSPSQMAPVHALGTAPLSHLQQDLLYMVQGALEGVTTRASADDLSAEHGLLTEGVTGAWIRERVARKVAAPRSARASVVQLPVFEETS